MKRLELFEFEDFLWLPSFIRGSVTKLIQVFHRLMGTSDVLIQIIQRIRQKTDFDQIVDLGSGSGGPMIDTVNKLNQSTPTDENISLLLTDKFPNRDTVENINELKRSSIAYRLESLDALDIADAPKGLKTMIASFHHMKPPVARQILKSAEDNQEPILIYEVAVNNVPVILWWLLLPLSLLILIVMCLIMTPFVKPVTATQLLFTYLIPVIPLVYAWDGQTSIMRTYTFDDIKELIGEQDESSYIWEISDAKKPNGKKAGYYVLGYPVGK